MTFLSQEALSHLLGDPNELTQDLASQGMSIVYELGDASMKEQLVHALLNTLLALQERRRLLRCIVFLIYILFLGSYVLFQSIYVLLYLH